MTSKREIARLFVKMEQDGMKQVAAAMAAVDAAGRDADKAVSKLNKSLGQTKGSGSVQQIARELQGAAKAADLWQDSAGKWRNQSGQFASATEKASAGIRQHADAIHEATKATDLWQDSQGKWRNSTGQFASATEKAAAGIRGFGDEFDGMRGKKKKADDLIKKNVGTFGQFGSALGAVNGVLGMLGGGFGALGASALALGPALLAVVAGAVALVAALGPLVGLAGAAAVGLGALAQGAGVVALASLGVADALKEQSEASDKAGKLATSSADQQRASARAIQAAQEGVRAAHDRVRGALDALRAANDQARGSEDALARAETARRAALMALGPAQEQATRDLEDMHSALADAALNERGAVQALTAARERLTNILGPAVAERLTAAQVSLTTSTLNEQRAVQGLTDARKRLADLLKPTDALTLADAQDAVADATRDQTRAALHFADTQKALAKILGDPKSDPADIAKAKLDLADAENAIGDASRSSLHAQQALADLQKGPDPDAIADAKLDIAFAENAVADAARDTTAATKELNAALLGADPAAVAAALLDIATAEKALTDATRDRARLQKDVADADKAGIQGSAVVVSALADIADANRAVGDAQDDLEGSARAVTDAERDVREAHRGVAKALLALSDAQDAAAGSSASAAIAAGDLNAKFDALPPAAQDFVRALQDMKPELDDLRDTAAAGLFPGVIAGMEAASGAFTPLKKVVGETATTLGNLATKAGELIGSKAFGADIETIGHRNAIILDRLGGAALYVMDALRHVMVAAGPLTTWLAKVAEGWAKNADEAAEAGRKSGKLADFFQSTRNTLIKVAGIVGDLATAFFNIGKAAGGLGRDGLDGIAAIADKFADWTKSVEGQKKLTEFFDRVKDVLAAIAPIIGNVAKDFGGLVFSVLPAYAKILEKLGPLATPLIATLLAFKAVATVASGLGSLAAFANPIGLVVLAIIALGTAFFIAYKKSEKFRDIVSGVWDSIKKVIPKAIGTVKKWLDLGGRDSDNLKKSLENLGKAAQWVFENVIKPAAERVFPALQEYLHGFVEQIGGFIKIVTGVLSGDWQRAWDGVKQVVEGAFRQVWAVLGLQLGVFYDAGKLLVGALIDGLKAAPGALLDAAVWIVTHIDDAIIAQYKLIYEVGKWLVETALEGFKSVPGALTEGARWLRDTLKTAITSLAGSFKNRGEDILGWAVEGFKSLPGKIAGAASWLRDTLKTGLEGIAATFVNRGKDVIGWVADGLQSLPAKLAGFASWLVGTLKDNLIAGAGFFVNRGLDVLGWITNGLRPEELPKSLANFASWLTKTLGDLLGGAVKGFTDLGGSIMGWIIDGLKTGAFALQGFLNKIIDLVNVIPGVDIKHIDKLSKDPKTGEVKGFAHGGAFARTGGIVDSPITLMGEEAPRHREWVIPENPAYRGRAQQLAMMAANAVGLATGGVYTASKFGGHDDPSAYGHQTASGKIADDTLWGFAELSNPPGSLNFSALGGLGMGTKIDIGYGGKTAKDVPKVDVGAGGPGLNGHVRAVDMTYAVAQALGFSGLADVQVNGGGKSVFSKIGDVVGSVVDALNPLNLIGKLPGAGDLPDWLKGLGKHVLSGVGGWIKDQVSSVIPGVGGGGTDATGLQAAVKKALAFAGSHGWTGSVTSGWRSRAEQQVLYDRYKAGIGNKAAPPGSSMHEKGLAVDVSDTEGFARAMDQMGAGALMRKVAGEPWHFSTTGFADGGMFGGLPYIGKYHQGGVAPVEGYAHVSRGEVMTPRGQQPEVKVSVEVYDHTTKVFVNGEEQINAVIDKRERESHGSFVAGVA